MSKASEHGDAALALSAERSSACRQPDQRSGERRRACLDGLAAPLTLPCCAWAPPSPRLGRGIEARSVPSAIAIPMRPQGATVPVDVRSPRRFTSQPACLSRQLGRPGPAKKVTGRRTSRQRPEAHCRKGFVGTHLLSGTLGLLLRRRIQSERRCSSPILARRTPRQNESGRCP